MIIRLWTAHATPEGAAKSLARFTRQILPKLKPLPGYRGATFLRRPDRDQVELVLLTRWQSLDAVRAFAGDDIERAVVDEEAATMLTRWDRRVRHYQVAHEDQARGASGRAGSGARGSTRSRTRAKRQKPGASGR